MEPHQLQQATPAHAIKHLLEHALSTELQPTIKPLDRTVSVLLCYWDIDAYNYPDIHSGIERLHEIFEADYGFRTKVHELEQAMSASKNQLTLLSMVQPLIYDHEVARKAVQCRCNKYHRETEEAQLFIFFYVGFAQTARDGSCLLRPFDPPSPDSDCARAVLPSVNLSSVSRATMDICESRVLTLLDCPYEGSSTTLNPRKELIAAGQALSAAPPTFEFTAHLAHHLRQAAQQKRILNTPLLFSRLANTLSTPPFKAVGAGAGQTASSSPPPEKYEPISLSPRDTRRDLLRMSPEYIREHVRRWQPMGVDEPGANAEITISVRHHHQKDNLADNSSWQTEWNREGEPPRIRLSPQTEDETHVTLGASVWYCLQESPAVTLIGVGKTENSEEVVANMAPLPKRPRKKKKEKPDSPPRLPQPAEEPPGLPPPDENMGFPAPQKPKFRLDEHSKSGLQALLQGIAQNR